MSVASATEVTIPHGYETNGAWSRAVRLRPWSSREEICIEEQTEALTPAALVTSVLAECLVEPRGVDFVRKLVAGDRVALLLHLRRLTLGGTLGCVANCAHCGAKLDLEMAVSDLLVPPYEQVLPTHEVQIDSIPVRFRLPNGRDLEECGKHFRRDGAAGVRMLLWRCIEGTNGNVYHDQPSVMERVGDEMAALDTQAELRIASKCAICDRQFDVLFDATSFVLEEIRQKARRLLTEVHILASTYHWSESDILALPRKRRHHYLALVDRRSG